jgi:hypothetical protein
LERVKIEWWGPYSIDSILTEGKWDPDDFGVYMLTCKWGKSRRSILYIGQTYWRDFGTRLPEHEWWIREERGKINIRLGYVNLGVGKISSSQRLWDIENLLVYATQPKYNIQLKRGYYGRI